jgi:hypothetical protein
LNGRASASTSVTVQVFGLRSVDSEVERDCRGFDPDDPAVMVLRGRRLTFVDERILFLPLPLKESCSDRVCGEGETCIGGGCVPMDIEASGLAEYRPELLFGDTNTCLAADTCLRGVGGLPVQVLLDDISDCSFSVVPLGGKLDFDGDAADPALEEGFGSTPDGDPLRFRLAPNLCEHNYKQDRILAVEAGTACAAKRSLQPLCTPRGGANASTPTSEPASSRWCTIDALRPVESAISILLDASSTMLGYFAGGADDLSPLVELSLSNPIARRTSVALATLPAESECAPNLSTERVPLTLAPDARAPIGEFLRAPGSVIAGAPDLYLSTALQGAYSKLRSLAPAAGERFNRRAVVVISNRDLTSGACPGGSIEQLASDALASSRIVTYAVALDDGDPTAIDSASALATAGGTSVFDGINNPSEGAQAMQKILTELGTCLYRPAELEPAALPTRGRVAYLDSLLRQVDIEHNPDCADGVDVPGWNLEDGLIRVCGADCSALRDAVNAVAVTQALARRAAPPVPLVMTAPCQ